MNITILKLAQKTRNASLAMILLIKQVTTSNHYHVRKIHDLHIWKTQRQKLNPIVYGSHNKNIFASDTAAIKRELAWLEA